MPRCVIWFCLALVPAVGLAQAAERASIQRLVASKQFAVALPRLEKLEVVEPKDGAVPALIGECHFGLERWEDAVVAFARAVTKAPELVSRLPHYGLALVKLGRLDEAWAVYVAAEQRAPNDELRMQGAFGKGLVRIHQGKEEEAVEHLQRAHALEPTSRKVNSRLGLLLRSLGRFPEAIVHLKLAIERYGLHEAAAHNLALSYAQLGKREEAEAWRQRHAAIRRATEAIGDLRRALDEAPGNPELLGRLADTYFDFDCFESAANWYGALSRARPTDPGPCYRRALCFVRRGDDAQARVMAEAALARDREHAGARSLLDEIAARAAPPR